MSDLITDLREALTKAQEARSDYEVAAISGFVSKPAQDRAFAAEAALDAAIEAVERSHDARGERIEALEKELANTRSRHAETEKDACRWASRADVLEKQLAALAQSPSAPQGEGEDV